MTKPRITTMFEVISLAMVLAGQARAQDTPAPSGAGCEVQVTGAVTASWKADWKDGDEPSGNVGAMSDYWLSEPDLRETLADLAAPGEDAAKKVLQGMRRNPRLVVLLLNCIGDGGGLVIRPSPKSIYLDVPRKPTVYQIVPQRSAAAGQFVVPSLKVGKTYYSVNAGRLVVKKFNFERVTGTFSVKAVPVGPDGEGREISLQGRFDFPCAGTGSRCKSR